MGKGFYKESLTGKYKRFRKQKNAGEQPIRCSPGIITGTLSALHYADEV
jgi:hypothetical protein